MRVALVHMRQRGTGGTERYLNQVSRHLAEQGHEVTVVCRSHEEAPHPAIRFVVLRRIGLGGAWRMWAFARAVEGHVRTAAYDVVFGLGKTWTHDAIRLGGGCHQTYLDLMEPARSSWWRASLKDRVALAIEAKALSPSAYRWVVVNSEMVKRDVVRRYAVPEPAVTVIYNGVDLERFHARKHAARGVDLRRACGFSQEDFVILFLGTGYERKGLARVLDVFPDLIRARPRVRLLVVGYDSSAAAYERAAAQAGVAPQVRFLGGRRDPEVCYAASDLYVLPTLYDPFANSTLEALATGLPVITTSANGGGEILTHRVHGSVLQAGADRASLLDELLFWTEGDRARSGGRPARMLAEHYSQEKTVRETSALLEDVVAEKRRIRAAAVGS